MSKIVCYFRAYTRKKSINSRDILKGLFLKASAKQIGFETTENSVYFQNDQAFDKNKERNKCIFIVISNILHFINIIGTMSNNNNDIDIK